VRTGIHRTAKLFRSSYSNKTIYFRLARVLNHCLLACICLFTANVLSASEAQRVASIDIEGLKRTDAFVVYREIGFKQGDYITEEKLAWAVQELKNLRLFSEVNTQTSINQDDSINVTFKLREKWTTIPVFTYIQGGESQYFVTGLYDINTFGRYLETGAQ
jgi:hypothetical protein